MKVIDASKLKLKKLPDGNYLVTKEAIRNAPTFEADPVCYGTEWIKLYEQAPPVNEDVEVKVLTNGEERIYVNRITPLMNGQYVWEYCDYDGGDEVVAWRRLTSHD